MTTISNYIGHKGGHHIKPQLFNIFPTGNRYISFFAGGAGFESLPEFATINWIVAEKDKSLHPLLIQKNFLVFNTYQILCSQIALQDTDVIFCDPPYLFECRANKKPYYKHEFDTNDHVAFLNCIRSLQSKIVITHPQNELYDSILPNWTKTPMKYKGRQGVVKDCIYTNFDPAVVELFCYDYLGKTRTKRQQIKRKRSNIIKRIKSLPLHERQAVLKKIQSIQWQSSKHRKV